MDKRSFRTALWSALLLFLSVTIPASETASARPEPVSGPALRTTPTPGPTPSPTPTPLPCSLKIKRGNLVGILYRGEAFTLSVEATAGELPITYQWYIGPVGATGNPVPGATESSLTVEPDVTTQYWVDIRNPCGKTGAGGQLNVSRRQNPGDFNGDHFPEVVVFRNGAWIDVRTGWGVWTGQSSPSCIPAPADYDGDRKVDYSLLCDGAWHFFNGDGSYRKGIWTGGFPGDLPVPSDYDGDGDDDVVVYRGGAWLFFDYATGQFLRGVWTGPGAGSIPLPMDFDGDGAAEFTSFHNGAWHFFQDNGSYFKGIWIGGVPRDIPVPADYDGDGREEPAIFRDGLWMFYDLASKQQVRSAWTGAASFNGDALQPAPVDRDADGLFELSIFSGGPWQFYNRDGSFSKAVWTGGVPGDQPISRRQHVNP